MQTVPDSVFYEDWLACLRAHYAYALSTNDDDNAKGLRQVLLEMQTPVEELDEIVAYYAPEPPPIEVLPEENEALAETPDVIEAEVEQPPVPAETHELESVAESGEVVEIISETVASEPENTVPPTPINPANNLKKPPDEPLFQDKLF